MATVAAVVHDDYEDSELDVPVARLTDAGHTVTIVGLEADRRLAGKRGNSSTTVERTTGEVTVDDFDALLIPGGWSPDKLRLDEDAVALTRAFVRSGKPVAAICHAGQLLIEADVVAGRTLTSYPSVRTDLINAGAEWVDRQVVEDGNLITSRRPDDLEAFSKALLDALAG